MKACKANRDKLPQIFRFRVKLKQMRSSLNTTTLCKNFAVLSLKDFQK